MSNLTRIQFMLEPPEGATTKPRILGLPGLTWAIGGQYMKPWRVYYPCGIGYAFRDSFDTLPEAYQYALRWYEMKDAH